MKPVLILISYYKFWLGRFATEKGAKAMRSVDIRKEDFTEKEKRNIDILEILRRYGPISRPDISREIGINVVTISNYIDD